MSYETWLEESNQHRFLLAEIDFRDPATGNTITLYFGTENYITTNRAVTAQVLYESRLSPQTYHRRRLPSFFGGLALTEVGSAVINNTDGKYDYLISDGYDPREVRYLHGGPDLVWADWGVYTFNAADIGVLDRNYLEITLPTKQLDAAFCKFEEVTALAEGEKRPVALGQLFYIEPPMYTENGSNVFFRFSDRACTGPIQFLVVDGVVNNTLINTQSGTTFSILKTNYTNQQVNINVIGQDIDGVAETDLAAIVERILVLEGLTVDATSVAQTSASRPYTAGVYERSERKTREILQEICEAENLVITSDLNGTYFVKPIEFGTSVVTLRAARIKKNSLSAPKPVNPVWKVRIGWSRIWSPVRNPADTAVPASLAVSTKEYRWKSQEDSTVKDDYDDAIEKEFGTFMSLSADADIEKVRRLNFYKTKMYEYTVVAFGTVNQVNIGDTYTIWHPRINSGIPKDLICVAIETEFVSNKITITGVG